MREEVTEDLVEEIDAGEVGRARLHHFGFVDFFGAETSDRAEGHWMLGAVAPAPHTRRCDTIGQIAIEVAARRGQWKMRTAKRSVEQPGLVWVLVALLAQPGGGFAGDDLFLQHRLWYLAQAGVLRARSHIHAGARALLVVEVEWVKLVCAGTAEVAVGAVLKTGELPRAAQV